MMKTIAIYVGSRSDYGQLFPIIDEINNHPDLEYLILVSGVNESPNYNYFIAEIENDGFDISCQVNLPDLSGISKINTYNSIIMSDLSKSLQILEPDYMMVVDGTFCSLAAAQTAFFLNIPVIQVHTRKISGINFKDSVRSAITQLSSIHISPDEEVAKYLIDSGADAERIFISGSPVIEACEIFSQTDDSKIAKRYSLDLNLPMLIYCFDPPFRNFKQSINRAKNCLEVLKNCGYQTIITFPELSPGREDFIELLTQYKTTSNFQINEVIGYKDYIELIKICSLVIGNTTKWALEAGYFKKWLLFTGEGVNEKAFMNNVVRVEADKDSLCDKIEEFLLKDTSNNNNFTDYPFENTGELISDYISNINFSF